MQWREKVADVDRGYPEDEENLHWPEDPDLDEDEDGLDADEDLDDDDDLDALDENLEADEEDLAWAIPRGNGSEEWE